MLRAMAMSRTPPWSELAQLVPVISLAFPFIIAGRVDLAQAGWGICWPPLGAVRGGRLVRHASSLPSLGPWPT